MPIVNSHGSWASVRKVANQAKPVKTITGPSGLRGRRRRATRPLPTNAQPTSSASGALAVWYGSKSRPFAR